MIGSEVNLASIVKDQYLLARHANISIAETNEMADFERDVYLSQLIGDLKKEERLLKK